jgi:hypothetical protein
MRTCKRVFEPLAVLDAIISRADRTPRPQLERTIFVCVQHLLETTGSLIESLLDLGADPRNIFVLGKCYSSNASVLQRLLSLGVHARSGTVPGHLGTYRAAMSDDVARMWATVSLHVKRGVERVVVLDDGGMCLGGLPENLIDRVPVVGIEQTTSGLIQLRAPKCPIIEVASSAAKRLLEPPLIAMALRTKLSDLFADRARYRCGVIGFGHIGQAVVAGLAAGGHSVRVYDKIGIRGEMPAGSQACNSLSELMAASDMIFGCAGADVMSAPTEALRELTGKRVFISCSSGDIEFNELLREIGRHSPQLQIDPLATLQTAFPTSRLQITVVRGGFPANFDRTTESVPSRDIQLTRGLLLGALLQASECAIAQPRQARPEMLSPFLQQFVVDEWARRASLGAMPSMGHPGRTDVAYLRSESGGVVADHRLDALFLPEL